MKYNWPHKRDRVRKEALSVTFWNSETKYSLISLSQKNISLTFSSRHSTKNSTKPTDFIETTRSCHFLNKDLHFPLFCRMFFLVVSSNSSIPLFAPRDEHSSDKSTRSTGKMKNKSKAWIVHENDRIGLEFVLVILYRREGMVMFVI